MPTHAIDSDLMDRIIKHLKFMSSKNAQKRFVSPNLAKEIEKTIKELNLERDWVVISVLHPGRLVEMADDPLAKLAWEHVGEIANNVSNNQQYDDALDAVIDEEWEKFLEEQKPNHEQTSFLLPERTPTPAIILETGAIEESTVSAYCGLCGQELPYDAIPIYQQTCRDGTLNFIVADSPNTRELLELRTTAPTLCPRCGQKKRKK